MCDPLPTMPLEVARTTFKTEKGDPKFILYANDWLASAADIFGHLFYDLPQAVPWTLAQDLIERNIYSSLQVYYFVILNLSSWNFIGFVFLTPVSYPYTEAGLCCWICLITHTSALMIGSAG